jgi:hypothetical protein
VVIATSATEPRIAPLARELGVRHVLGSRLETEGGTSVVVTPVAVLPPVPIDGWAVEELDEKVAEIRGQFLATLENWPTG